MPQSLFIFFSQGKVDERLLPSHISLYLALYWFWQRGGFSDSFNIYRKELMPIARINSVATYHKCLKDLCDFGYISGYTADIDHPIPAECDH